MRRLPANEKLLLRVFGVYDDEERLQELVVRRFNAAYRIAGFDSPDDLVITRDGRPLEPYRMDAFLRELVGILLKPRRVEGDEESREWNLVQMG